ADDACRRPPGRLRGDDLHPEAQPVPDRAAHDQVHPLPDRGGAALSHHRRGVHARPPPRPVLHALEDLPDPLGGRREPPGGAQPQHTPSLAVLSARGARMATCAVGTPRSGSPRTSPTPSTSTT